MSVRSRLLDFTPLETAVIVVVVALLFAVSIPLRGILRNRRYADELSVYLTALATQQESYLYDHAAYAGMHGQLVALVANPNLTVTVQEATSTGWSAIAAHRSGPVQCSLFVGNAAPVGAATDEGDVECG